MLPGSTEWYDLFANGATWKETAIAAASNATVTCTVPTLIQLSPGTYAGPLLVVANAPVIIRAIEPHSVQFVSRAPGPAADAHQHRATDVASRRKSEAPSTAAPAGFQALLTIAGPGAVLIDGIRFEVAAQGDVSRCVTAGSPVMFTECIFSGSDSAPCVVVKAASAFFNQCDFSKGACGLLVVGDDESETREEPKEPSSPRTAMAGSGIQTAIRRKNNNTRAAASVSPPPPPAVVEVTVEDCGFKMVGGGIRCCGGGDTTVVLKVDHVTVEDVAGTGIHIGGATRATVKDSVLSHCQAHGFLAEGSCTVWLIQCNVEGCGQCGILATDEAKPVVQNCTIKGTIPSVWASAAAAAGMSFAAEETYPLVSLQEKASVTFHRNELELLLGASSCEPDQEEEEAEGEGEDVAGPSSQSRKAQRQQQRKKPGAVVLAIQQKVDAIVEHNKLTITDKRPNPFGRPMPPMAGAGIYVDGPCAPVIRFNAIKGPAEALGLYGTLFGLWHDSKCKENIFSGILPERAYGSVDEIDFQVAIARSRPGPPSGSASPSASHLGFASPGEYDLLRANSSSTATFRSYGGGAAGSTSVDAPLHLEPTPQHSGPSQAVAPLEPNRTVPVTIVQTRSVEPDSAFRTVPLVAPDAPKARGGAPPPHPPPASSSAIHRNAESPTPPPGGRSREAELEQEIQRLKQLLEKEKKGSHDDIRDDSDDAAEGGAATGGFSSGRKARKTNSPRGKLEPLSSSGRKQRPGTAPRSRGAAPAVATSASNEGGGRQQQPKPPVRPSSARPARAAAATPSSHAPPHSPSDGTTSAGSPDATAVLGPYHKWNHGLFTAFLKLQVPLRDVRTPMGGPAPHTVRDADVATRLHDDYFERKKEERHKAEVAEHRTRRMSPKLKPEEQLEVNYRMYTESMEHLKEARELKVREEQLRFASPRVEFSGDSFFHRQSEYRKKAHERREKLEANYLSPIGTATKQKAQTIEAYCTSLYKSHQDQAAREAAADAVKTDIKVTRPKRHEPAVYRGRATTPRAQELYCASLVVSHRDVGLATAAAMAVPDGECLIRFAKGGGGGGGAATAAAAPVPKPPAAPRTNKK